MSTAKTAEKPGHRADRVAAPNIAFSAKLPRNAAFEKALIKQYGEAIRLSKEAGHSVSFRVVVDPRAGAQMISLMEEQPSVFPVEQAGEPSDGLKAALSEAVHGGKSVSRKSLPQTICSQPKRLLISWAYHE